MMNRKSPTSHPQPGRFSNLPRAAYLRQFAIILAILIWALGAPIHPVSAASTSLEASADTFMKSGTTFSTLNYGSSTTLEANPYSNTSDKYRGMLLRWDTSTIPSSAQVTAASITFYITDRSNNSYRLYNLRRSWIEGSNNGVAGTGSSWDYYGSTSGAGSWGTAGAQNNASDRYDTNLWDATTTTFNTTGSVTIPLNAAGIAVVQGWITGSSTNFGLTLQNYSGTSHDLLVMASRENASQPGPTLNLTFNSAPYIGVSNTPGYFSTQPGTASAPQIYSVFGYSLTSNVAITAPAGFELSLDGNTYTSSITLTPLGNGNLPSTPVYVRLTNPIWGLYIGDITHTSTGAASVNMSVSGRVSSTLVCSTTSLAATEDTYLMNTNANSNYGGWGFVRAANNEDSMQRGMLLKWNVSSIPTNTVIARASMTVDVSHTSAEVYNLYNLRRSWIEGTSSSETSYNSATWNNYNGTNSWGTGGAANTTSDRYSANLWNAGSTSFSALGSTTVDFNSDGLQVIQGWIEGTVTNHGLTVQNYSTVSGSEYLEIASTENTSKPGPKLNIEYCYTVIPTTISIVASAGEHGTITPSGPLTINYLHDQTYTINTTTTGYHIADVLVDGVSVGPVSTYTFNNVEEDHTITASFAINTYTLNYTAGAGGTLTGSTTQTVNYNGSGTPVTAFPNTGYHFVNWSDGSSTNPRTDTNVTTNRSVTANFAIDTFTLTYAAGAGGTLAGSTTQTVNYNASGTPVTAVPNTGYHFVNWSDGSTANPRTDLNVTTNIDVAANFAIGTYTLNYTAGTGGSLTGDTSQSVTHGANGTTVTAVPNTGYHFTGWSDGVSGASRTDLNVTADINVTATFSIDTFTLNYAAGEHGSLSGEVSQVVNYGMDGSAVTAVPDAGYHFANWSDNSTDNPRTDANVTDNLSVTANFAINSYTLAYAAGTGGTLEGAASQQVNHGEDGTTVTAVPNTGYHFTGWSDGVSEASRTDLDVTGNITATANFAINTYTLTYAAGTGGTLEGAASQQVNHGEDGTTITAVPNTGYHFTSWSDGVSEASRTDLDVTGDITVTANFAINTYTLTYTAGTGGTLEGAASQQVNHGEDGTTVTAVPNTGYHFTGWSDGVSEASRTDLDVTGNITVTANFAIDTFALNYTAGEHGSLSGEVSQIVDYGTDGTAVTAVPQTGYHFTGWSDGSTDNPRTDLAVTANLDVSASFAIDTFTITASAGDNGSISPSGSLTVNYHDDQTFIIAPTTGYHIANVLVDGKSVGAVASYTFENVEADHTIAATFAIDTFTITASAGDHGSISPAGAVSVNYHDDQTFTIAPAAGYHIANVLVDDSSVGQVTSYTFENIEGNHTITATFAIDTFTISASAGANGSISPVGDVSMNYHDDQTFTIAPAAGYHIANVLVDGSSVGQVASYTFEDIEADHTIAATFAIDTFTITASADDHGSISPAGVVSVNYHDDQTFTIAPTTGYHIADVLVGVAEKSGQI